MEDKKFKLFISHSSVSPYLKGKDSLILNNQKNKNNYNLLIETCQKIKKYYKDKIQLLIDIDIKPGANWEKTLNKWIEECDAAIIIFSENAIKNSKWIKKEATILSWRRDLDENFILIPVLLDGQVKPEDLNKDLFGIINILKSQCVKNVTKSSQILNSIIESIGDFNNKEYVKQYLESKTTSGLNIIQNKLLTKIHWIKINSSYFSYGKNQNEQKIFEPSFFISQFLITVEQFQEFINDGGYNNKQWWLDMDMQTPAVQRSNKSEHPRSNLNWYECIAYCRWLSNKLGYEITLPTEHQWEKVIKGESNNLFPWGNKFIPGYACIDNKQGICSVGIHKKDKTSSGVYDMVGNVMEWCLNKYESPSCTIIDKSNDARVLRGFSWLDKCTFSDSTRRLRAFPYMRQNERGFRVVCNIPNNTD